MRKISKVLFIGSKKLGLKCLSWIYSFDPSLLVGAITLDDRDDPRSVYNEFQVFSSETNVKLFVVKNQKEFDEVIRRLKPELCIVVGWYWLIRKETLAAVPNGFLGIHYSLLPKYRGGSPLVWAMINGDSEVGVSLFSLTEGMDDGDIWGQCAVKVEFTDYVSDVLDKLQKEAISLLAEKFPDIINKAIKPIPQDHSKATYCAPRFAHDGLIDWGKPAMQVYNFIRAQSEPYPGAFTFYNGHKLIIWRAQPLDLRYYGEPGQVARITEEGIYVICGDQKPVLLEVVQLESLGKVSPNTVIRSIKTRFPRYWYGPHRELNQGELA